MNPVTKIYLEKGATFIMETTQLNGIDLSNRETFAELKENAKIYVKESVSTNLKQECNSIFEIKLKGKESSAQIVSRSVATGNSKMKFTSKVIGEEKCFGHIECDAIIQDGAQVVSIPEISAKNQPQLVYISCAKR
jgi:Fe-S cluster assembly scaffold protein SufB